MATENRVDSTTSATDSVPACRSMPSAAQLSVPPKPASVCFACGRDGDVHHRLKHDGVVRYFCSSCILFLYKGMYCCLCFVVYETPAAKGDSSLWDSCVKCQRIAHVKCVRENECSQPFTCRKCSQPEKAQVKDSCVSTEAQDADGSPPFKRLRLSGDEQNACTLSHDDQQSVPSPPEESLAAAQIVALLAVQHAKDAKTRARASAAVAARAAARAKAALDTAYRVAQEDARWKPESSRHISAMLPGSNRPLPSLSATNAPKNMRVDGGILIPSSRLYSDSISQRDQVGRDSNATSYGLLNARVTAQQYHKTKALPSSAEAGGALTQIGTLQKPQVVCRQEVKEATQNGGPAMESEGVVSTSPAGTLDATAPLDIPQVNSSAGSGLGHCSAVAAAISVSSSFMVSTNKAHLQTSKDQILDKKDERSLDSAANTKHRSISTCVIDVERKYKDAVDGSIDACKHTVQK